MQFTHDIISSRISAPRNNCHLSFVDPYDFNSLILLQQQITTEWHMLLKTLLDPDYVGFHQSAKNKTHMDYSAIFICPKSEG